MGQATRRTTDRSGPYLRGRPSKRFLPRTSMLIGSAVTAVALGGALLGDHGIPSFMKLRAERRALEAEVRDLETREQALSTDLDALEQDDDLLERVARERYRMHRPGETVIEVIGGPDGEPEDNPPPSP